MSSRITEKQLEVLRLAKDESVWSKMSGSRNGGRARTVNTLRRLKYLDWQNKLTVEGMRILEDQSR